MRKGQCGHQTGQHHCAASLTSSHALQNPLTSIPWHKVHLSVPPQIQTGVFTARSHVSKAEFKNSPFLQLLK